MLDPEYNSFAAQITFNSAPNPDLLAVANSVGPLIGQNINVYSVNDVAILEFDFVPVSDTLSFYYVFASSEYFGYENTVFNDAFAFFISGPGITGPYSSPPGFPGGSKNIAVVPESNPELPITISSVNSSLNSEYFIENTSFSSFSSADGFTVPLEAKAIVQCGETYHIKLVIGDGSDTGLPSYIFLGANSFASNEVTISNDFNNQSVTDLVIPCGSTVDLTAQLPALNTSDFIWNTSETSQTISVSEGDYWVSLNNGDGCSYNSDTIRVRFPEPPAFAFEDNLSVCNGDSIILALDFISGNGPFEYNWSTGEFSEDFKCFNSDDELTLDFVFTGEPPFVINYGIEEDQFIDTIFSNNYLKDVSDVGIYSVFELKDNFCFGFFSGNGILKSHSSFSSTIKGNKEICYGEEAILEIKVEDLDPPFDIKLNNNLNGIYFNNVTSNPFLIPVTDTALYTVDYIEDLNGCKSDINTGTAYVTYKKLNEPNIIPPLKTSFCQVDSAIQLYSDIDGGFWSGKGVTTDGFFIPINAAEGVHFVYYTYPQNCNEGDSIMLTVGCDYELFIPSTFTPNGDGINDFFEIQSNNLLEFNMNIFDRWGSLIYSTNSISNFWDGTLKGELVPSGNYTYNINLFAKNSKYYNKSGVINVIY